MPFPVSLQALFIVTALDLVHFSSTKRIFSHPPRCKPHIIASKTQNSLNYLSIDCTPPGHPSRSNVLLNFFSSQQSPPAATEKETIKQQAPSHPFPQLSRIYTIHPLTSASTQIFQFLQHRAIFFRLQRLLVFSRALSFSRFIFPRPIRWWS